jgi:hypothetical protein
VSAHLGKLAELIPSTISVGRTLVKAVLYWSPPGIVVTW